MNVVFLSPDFPPNFVPFSEELANVGVRVLGVTTTPREALDSRLQAALHGHYRVDTLEDIEQLRAALRFFTETYGQIDAIESLNEHWLATEAQLRADFGVPGWLPSNMSSIKRKSVMKQHFEHAGVDVAPGVVATDDATLRAFIDRVGYPVVVKPDIGVGAARTYKLQHEGDIAEFWATKPEVDYFAEAYVTGTIVTYDGLTDSSGRVVLATSMEYGKGVMETVHADDDIFFYVVRDVPQDLVEAGQRVADEFDVRRRYFHFEFFRRPDGGLTALEVNMRAPGGPCVDMSNYAHDLSMFRQWAEIVVHDRVTATPSKANFALYASRKDSIHYAADDDQVARELGHLLISREGVNPLFAAIMGNRGFVLKGPDLDELRAAAGRIHQRA